MDRALSKRVSMLRRLGGLAAIVASLCMAQVKSQQLQVADVANEQFLRGPTVKSSGNIVNIDDKSVPNEYFGNLYIGSEAWRATVCYDTVSDWTVVSSDFDIYASDTQNPWKMDNGTITRRSVNLGPGMELEGPVYTDNICLIHSGEPGDTASARLCVKDLPFILAPIVADVNTYQGVLGLARGPKDRPSYVKLLQQQGVIKDAIVSFNFEDPEEWSQMSQVAFGEILYSEIEGGVAQANYYTNLGREQWGLLIDDFLYNDQDMTNGQRAKVALIDSGNVSIQLPRFVWDNVLVSMQHEAMGASYRVVQEATDSGMPEIRIPNKNCKDVWQYLKPISFKLENTTIVIEPRGYTYQLDSRQGYCQVGLQPTPGESNEYRLGTIFLRNFYTALDYDSDLIVIGVNRGSAQLAKATVVGHRANPFLKKEGGNVAVVFVVVILVVLAVVAAVAFVLRRRELAKKKRQQALAEQEEGLVEQDKSEGDGAEDDEPDKAEYEGVDGGAAEANDLQEEETKKTSNYLVPSDAAEQIMDEGLERDEEEEVVPATQA